MSDIIAQLEVLSRDNGCLLDLSAILDLSICPKINLKTEKDHKVEEKDDYICVTPTDDKNKNKHDKKDKKDHGKHCTKGSCFEVHDKVCKKSHVAMDYEILVILGLLTQDELEKYLKTIGDMDEDDKLDMSNNDDVKMDPLLSLGVGDDDSILDLEVLGEDGLLDLDLGDNESVLNLGGDGPLLNLGGKDKGLLGLGGLLRRRSYGSENQPLADVQVGGKKDKNEAVIDVDVLTTHHKRSYTGPNQNGYKHRNQRLADVQIGGQKDDDEAAIDVDVLTHSKRDNKSLLDLQVGGEADENEATIDVDLLTHKGKGNNGNGNGNTGNGNSGNGNGSNGNGNGDSVQNGNNHHDKYYLSHYQPICKKGLKKNSNVKKSHARDVNHCLAICHSQSALLTIEADVKVGDVANILICAAIEFNSSEEDNNCSYFVSGGDEPCTDDHLEEKDDCTTLIRN